MTAVFLHYVYYLLILLILLLLLLLAASQQQIICRTVSVSFLQNLQVGSSSNRPTVYRCPLTAACPVRIAATIFSWCLLSLSRSSALFLHGLPIKSLPCLWPGKFLQACILPCCTCCTTDYQALKVFWAQNKLISVYIWCHNYVLCQLP